MSRRSFRRALLVFGLAALYGLAAAGPLLSIYVSPGGPATGTSDAPEAGEVRPAAVDPRLETAVSEGPWRFLVYRVCSSEHCWSESFLQEIGEVDGPVLSSCPIEEIQLGHRVRSAEWQWEGEAPQLRLELAPSHGGFAPFVALLEPARACQYTLTREEGDADSQAPAR